MAAAFLLTLLGLFLAWNGVFAFRDPKGWVAWQDRFLGAGLLARYRAAQSGAYQAAGLYFVIVGSLFAIFGARLIWRAVITVPEGQLIGSFFGILAAIAGASGLMLLANPVRALSRFRRRPPVWACRVTGAVLLFGFGGALMFAAVLQR